jgi:hypothetical protein
MRKAIPYLLFLAALIVLLAHAARLLAQNTTRAEAKARILSAPVRTAAQHSNPAPVLKGQHLPRLKTRTCPPADKQPQNCVLIVRDME